MLSNDALTMLRATLMGKFSYAAYLIDDTEYTAVIQSASLLDDGRIETTFIIDHTGSEAVTVEEVRLYDQNNVLLASKEESLTQEPGEDSILYRFVFTILEAD